MKKVLTIAGSDSGGCAGIQADIKTVSACGAFAMSAVTAVTSQNTLGVYYVEELSPKSVESQIDAIFSDIGADAVKSGMLFSKNIIMAVASSLKKYSPKNYVLDPVMTASSGARLLKCDAEKALISELLPLARIITPNVPEAEVLAEMEVKNQNDAKEACRRIIKAGPAAVLVKGGHFNGGKSTDVLYDGKVFRKYEAERVNTKNTHGTGCTYSAAIAACLAKGYGLYEAVGFAKRYITDAIKHGADMGIGSGSGPVNHFFMLRD